MSLSNLVAHEMAKKCWQFRVLRYVVAKTNWENFVISPPTPSPPSHICYMVTVLRRELQRKSSSAWSCPSYSDRRASLHSASGGDLYSPKTVTESATLTWRASVRDDNDVASRRLLKSRKPPQRIEGRGDETWDEGVWCRDKDCGGDVRSRRAIAAGSAQLSRLKSISGDRARGRRRSLLVRRTDARRSALTYTLLRTQSLLSIATERTRNGAVVMKTGNKNNNVAFQ